MFGLDVSNIVTSINLGYRTVFVHDHTYSYKCICPKVQNFLWKAFRHFAFSWKLQQHIEGPQLTHDPHAACELTKKCAKFGTSETNAMPQQCSYFFIRASETQCTVAATQALSVTRRRTVSSTLPSRPGQSWPACSLTSCVFLSSYCAHQIFCAAHTAYAWLATLCTLESVKGQQDLTNRLGGSFVEFSAHVHECTYFGPYQNRILNPRSPRKKRSPPPILFGVPLGLKRK